LGRPWEKLSFCPLTFAKRNPVNNRKTITEYLHNKGKKMFGLDKITWELFTKLVAMSLLGWYMILFIIAWLKDKNRQQNLYYEDYRTDNTRSDYLQPINVSSGDFPAELLSILSEKQIPLEPTFYEETGLDEGYGIDVFTEEDHPKLTEILAEVQYQK
jgi:hypothetical protein